MGLLSNTLLLLSTLLLTHSCYSAHEHTTTTSRLTPTSLPLDILLETIIGASLLCATIVLSNNQLRPIAHRVWAGKLEREVGAGPWGQLDERVGFLNIRTKRADFAEFVKAEGRS
ncbi:hypothetical protein EX30DRAFT_327806 [Ascodesmis nigricans]|uniref:Magnesium transporter n=1 Tax=Ascodesmis nigricans TaxID=341454 RepID=A0A4S2N493_9PEZI|nr:hypothetical protein EX30DRAFT_327806 [Ascodesmis nigricans]